MIVRNGRMWILKSKDGKKVLGKHRSKDAALAQERAILISKARHDKEK